jgi:hypothetical protein
MQIFINNGENPYCAERTIKVYLCFSALNSFFMVIHPKKTYKENKCSVNLFLQLKSWSAGIFNPYLSVSFVLLVTKGNHRTAFGQRKASAAQEISIGSTQGYLPSK